MTAERVAARDSGVRDARIAGLPPDREARTPDAAYVLSASRGRHARNHVVAGGKLGQNGTFKTACGLWGAVNEMPWNVGEMRREYVTCRRCRKALS